MPLNHLKKPNDDQKWHIHKMSRIFPSLSQHLNLKHEVMISQSSRGLILHPCEAFSLSGNCS